MRYLSFFLCLKYLRSKKIVFLSITAVAMSCALLITVASLFTGFINAVENGAGEHMGDIIISMPSGLKIPDYDKLIEDLQADPAIDGATAVLASQGLLLLDKGNVRAVRIWGIELPGRSRVSPVDEFLLKPPAKDKELTFALDNDSEELGGFVGIGVVAKADDITDEYDSVRISKDFIGKKVLLTTGAVLDTKKIEGEMASSGRGASGEAARFKRKTIKFTIANIVNSGMYEFDNNYIYLPIEMLSEELYPNKDKVADVIQIRLAPGTDIDYAAELVNEIWDRFATGRFTWANYARIDSSKEMQAQLIAEYRKQMKMLMLIFGVVSGGVILLVFCIFYLIVMTKQKDIAILKSCGLGSSGVAMMFVSFGLAVGAAGAALGVGLGYLAIKNINPIEHWISVVFRLKLWKSSTYMFTRIPNQIDWPSVFWVAAAAIIAAGLGALIPAIAAARLKPVEILRYE